MEASGQSRTVRFKPLSDQKPGEWDIVLSKDIDANGVLFDYPREIKPETLLSFKINLGIGQEPSEFIGKVLRCEPVNPSSRIFHITTKFFETGKTDL